MTLIWGTYTQPSFEQPINLQASVHLPKIIAVMPDIDTSYASCSGFEQLGLE